MNQGQLLGSSDDAANLAIVHLRGGYNNDDFCLRCNYIAPHHWQLDIGTHNA